MHTFQDISGDSLEFSVFQAIGKDWMLITAEKDEKVNTMTASWGGLGVIWNKNAAFVFIRDSRYTKEFVDHTDQFSLCFFGGGQKSAMKYLGAVSGRDEDKIKNSRLTVSHYQDVPYFDEASTVLICRKMALVPIQKESFLDGSIDPSFYANKDYHTLYIAEVLQIMAR